MNINIHDNIYLNWSAHKINYHPKYTNLRWNYKNWQIPINLTFHEFRSIIESIKADEVSILQRDSYAIYFEYFLINKILSSYRPVSITHIGTICRRSLILSELCQNNKLVVIQHGFLNYNNCYHASIDTFIHDENLPEQDFENYFNFKNGLNIETQNLDEKEKKSLANVLALSPNYTFLNLKTLCVLFLFNKKKWEIFCHPRSNKYFYYIICWFFHGRFKIQNERNVQIDFLITFKSSLIQQHHNEKIKIILLDYKKLHTDIATVYPNIKIVNQLRELRNV